MVSRSSVVLCLLAVMVGSSAAHAGPARPAPPLAAPAGAIVNVSTEAQLQSAVRCLASNTTIVIAPGTYVLSRTLYVKGVTNVGIRGATGNSDDVVLVGPGMSQAELRGCPVRHLGRRRRGRDHHRQPDDQGPLLPPDHLQRGRREPARLQRASDRRRRAVHQGQSRRPRRRRRQRHRRVLGHRVHDHRKDDYPKGVDIQTAQNWIVRHNLFRTSCCRRAVRLGAGILAWRGTSNTTVEGNTFVNCTRSVMLGADDYYSPSHARRHHPQQHRSSGRRRRRATSASSCPTRRTRRS